MKSAFFSRFDPNDSSNNEFGRDLLKILELSDKNIEAMLDAIARAQELKRPDQIAKIERELAASTGVPLTELSTGMNFMAFLLTHIIDEPSANNSVENFVSDAQELKLIGPHQLDKATSLFQKLLYATDSLSPVLRRKAFEEGVFPTLLRVGYTTELRGIQTKSFAADEDPDNYSPSYSGFLPIVSIRLVTKSEASKNETCVFQCSEAELDLLISQLRAAKRDLSTIASLAPRHQ